MHIESSSIMRGTSIPPMHMSELFPDDFLATFAIGGFCCITVFLLTWVFARPLITRSKWWRMIFCSLIAITITPTYECFGSDWTIAPAASDAFFYLRHPFFFNDVFVLIYLSLIFLPIVVTSGLLFLTWSVVTKPTVHPLANDNAPISESEHIFNVSHSIKKIALAQIATVICCFAVLIFILSFYGYPHWVFCKYSHPPVPNSLGWPPILFYHWSFLTLFLRRLGLVLLIVPWAWTVSAMLAAQRSRFIISFGLWQVIGIIVPFLIVALFLLVVLHPFSGLVEANDPTIMLRH